MAAKVGRLMMMSLIEVGEVEVYPGRPRAGTAASAEDLFLRGRRGPRRVHCDTSRGAMQRGRATSTIDESSFREGRRNRCTEAREGIPAGRQREHGKLDHGGEAVDERRRTGCEALELERSGKIADGCGNRRRDGDGRHW